MSIFIVPKSLYHKIFYHLFISFTPTKLFIYIKYILTHADYDKENWKNDPYF
ncbi:MAG: type II toxin-antitoxin system HigB family toxin [Crocosphaera sp.]|nr:type II toxin-antitoxin system HigB family toxin [Crocosphaera sp.]